MVTGRSNSSLIEILPCLNRMIMTLLSVRFVFGTTIAMSLFSLNRLLITGKIATWRIFRTCIGITSSITVGSVWRRDVHIQSPADNHNAPRQAERHSGESAWH